MQILGNGIDIVDNCRIYKLISNKLFIRRVFSKSEIENSKRIKNKTLYFAKRFAAKEAFSKALGTGISKGLSFKEITVYNIKTGKPKIRLSGKTKKLVNKLIKKKNINIFLSLSDDKPFAVATIVISI